MASNSRYLRHILGVERVPQEAPACRIPRLRNRAGRCFELAFRGCLILPLSSPRLQIGQPITHRKYNYANGTDSTGHLPRTTSLTGKWWETGKSTGANVVGFRSRQCSRPSRPAEKPTPKLKASIRELLTDPNEQ